MNLSRLPVLLLSIWLAGCGQRIIPHGAPVPLDTPEDVETTLYLIGDAGAPAPDEPVLRALGALLQQDSARSLVLFLGDNIYPRGMPPLDSPEFDSAAARLDAQIDVLNAKGAEAYFLPGNHDWFRFGKGGWDAVRRQEARVNLTGGPRVHFAPPGGCPGPVVVDVRTHLRLVLLDTQWWLHDEDKPDDPGDGCLTFTRDGVTTAVREALEAAGDRHVVVAGHHPLASGGEHGGFFDWKDHLFPFRNLKSWFWLPFPGIGTLYPLVRVFGISSQDIPGRKYQVMIRALSEAFQARPPLIFAAGHEHGLQVIRGGPARWQLVSGAGIYQHEGPVVEVPGTLLALQEAGFMRIDVLRDGRVRLGVVTVDRSGRSTEVYSRWLESR